MSHVVGPDTEVTLHFALRLAEDGGLIDSTFERAPATFRVGDGNLLPGFEGALMGLPAGTHDTFELAPEHAFGMRNPSNIQWFKRSDFSVDTVLEPGAVISFADAANAELPGVVASVDGADVEVDFNHPLAGRTLLFEAKIIDVKPVEG